MPIVKALTDIDPFAVEDDHAAAAERMHAAAERAAFIAGLHEIADWLGAHPEVPLPYMNPGHVNGHAGPSLPIYLHKSWGGQPPVRERLAAVARAMGRATKQPDHVDGNRFEVWRTFGPIAVYATAPRAEVCERVVVGEREETVEVPDPDAVAALPKVTVTKLVEDVEWRCGPLLSDSDGAL